MKDLDIELIRINSIEEASLHFYQMVKIRK